MCSSTAPCARGGRNDIARFAPAPRASWPTRDIAGTLYDLGAYPGRGAGRQRARCRARSTASRRRWKRSSICSKRCRPDDSGEYIKREVAGRWSSAKRLRCLVYEIHPRPHRGPAGDRERRLVRARLTRRAFHDTKTHFALRNVGRAAPQYFFSIQEKLFRIEKIHS